MCDGYAYVVVHWGMHVCAHVCICGYMCVVKEKQQEVFQILALYTRASPSRPRGCSDPHLHCSGPLMSNGSLSKRRLSATPQKWPEEEVKFPSFKETCRISALSQRDGSLSVVVGLSQMGEAFPQAAVKEGSSPLSGPRRYTARREESS